MNIKNQDLWKRIIVFLLGFIGIYLIVLILGLFRFDQWMLTLCDSEAMVDALLNFTVYILLFAIMLPILGKYILKDIVKEFTVPQNIKDGIAFGIIIISTTMLYNLIIQQFVDISSNQNEESVENIILTAPFLSTMTVAIIGPIVEEITYRYGLFGSLKKGNRYLAYIGTVLVFALIHFNFSSDKKILTNELLNLPTYLIAAGLLCYAYDRHESLATSITAHVFNNAVSVILTFISAAFPSS